MTPDRDKMEDAEETLVDGAEIITEDFIEDEDERVEEAVEELDKEDPDKTEDDVVFEVIDGKWVTDIEGVGEIGFRHLTRGEVNKADLFFVRKVNELKREGIPSVDELNIEMNMGDLEDVDIDSIVGMIPEGEEVGKDVVNKVSEAISKQIGLTKKMDAIGKTAESLASSERINMWMQCSTFVRGEERAWVRKWKTLEDLENESTETFNPIMGAFLRFRSRGVDFS